MSDETGSLFVNRIMDRLLKYDKNFMGIIVGETGIGKSSLSLVLAACVDKNFSIDRVAFSGSEFMKIINSGLPKGSAVVFDECGIGNVLKTGSGGMAAREFQSTSNKILSYVLQGFRSRNLAIFFTLPSLRLLDVQTKLLSHCIIECIDRTQNCVVAKVFQLQHNPRIGKDFYHYNYDDLGREMSIMYFDKPPAELWNKYLEKKKIWLDALALSVSDRLDDDTQMLAKSPAVHDLPAIASELNAQYPGKRITVHHVAAKHPELSHREIGIVKVLVENIREKSI